ncbi:hypothetical protein Pcinc_012587 [Petrolisthes cinctipes]|uniref:Uncharacterized protein n=1 Tax=Petrolisthes cinctipes TaxID=88211 RepID=A0AAE1KV83_PETCI|nr:hypothetical protein Pcinc_012587 [Petrolisthes cinctipes]
MSDQCLLYKSDTLISVSCVEDKGNVGGLLGWTSGVTPCRDCVESHPRGSVRQEQPTPDPILPPIPPTARSGGGTTLVHTLASTIPDSTLDTYL